MIFPFFWALVLLVLLVSLLYHCETKTKQSFRILVLVLVVVVADAAVVEVGLFYDLCFPVAYHGV